MKKILTILFSLAIFLTIIPSSAIIAENACDIDVDSEECEELLEASRRKQEELQAELEKANADFDEAVKLAQKYANDAAELEVEIDALTVQIDELVVKIDELTLRIEENEAKKEEINKRVLDRMESSQKTMHFSPLLDFILGSKGFSDMLRRTYGVEAIMSKEANDREELVRIIDELTKDKEELDIAKTELEESKKELVDKQAEYIIKKEMYERIEAELDEKIAQINNELESEKKAYRSMIHGDLSKLQQSSGFGRIMDDGIGRYTGYFPYYETTATWSDSATMHAGVDYAAPRYTKLYAPANAVVLVKYNGCKDPGYLGCTCGGDGNGNGAGSGGNQIYLMFSVNDRVYGMLFAHMNQAGRDRNGNDLFEIGDVVNQGEQIGVVGSSGNSSGPHCHVELFYLGIGDWEDIQNDYIDRSYSLSFNCYWGSTGHYNTRCAINGGKAPCRLNPMEYIPFESR